MSERTDRLVSFAAPLICSLILVVGSWFTTQADLRHLEARVTVDEQTIVRELTSLEARLHAVELDSGSRLSSIEARLVSIETHMMEMSALLRRTPGITSTQTRETELP